ncbi:hypothetical protein HZS_3303 [Henneguya salminicola]|nr:hypothetical protein HZS_3303 [Henneguya salminicola]
MQNFWGLIKRRFNSTNKCALLINDTILGRTDKLVKDKTQGNSSKIEVEIQQSILVFSEKKDVDINETASRCCLLVMREQELILRMIKLDLRFILSF